MKVETTEHSVSLIPETPYEKTILEKINHSGVDKVRFEDSWDLKGNLQLILNSHKWDM